ncbi:MAG: hypothetical protein IJ681_02070 [Bacteroidales bacterium]|nr:hypothetical protein [Bacteroidales bacterium]
MGLKGLQQLFGNVPSDVNDAKSIDVSTTAEYYTPKSNPRATVHYTFDRERYNEKKNEGFRLEF